MKMNQKVLSILFTLLLLFSTLFAPITTFADNSVLENEEDKTELNEKVKEENSEEKEDNEEATKEEEVISDNKNENNKADQQQEDTDKGSAEESNKEEEPTKDSKQKHDDQKETKENINETQERAPPVTVDVRVETHEKTLVPTTEVTVESFDLKEFISGNSNSSVKPDSPRAIHAIIKGLETVDGLDLKNEDDFRLGYQGNYIHDIGENKEFGPSGMAGWKFFIDNTYVDRGVLDREISDGESIVLYYTENFTDDTFSWFDSDSYTTKAGEPLEISITGSNMNTSNPIAVENASILIDEEEYSVDGDVVHTDEDGTIEVVFDEPGTYHLSANRMNDQGERNIVRPYAIVDVAEGEKEDETDTVPPEITVEGLEDGKVVSDRELNFTATAMDDMDGEVIPTVRVNDQDIEGKDNQYAVELDEGENTIAISATDKAGNKATTTFNITYEPKQNDSYQIEDRIDRTTKHILSKGVSSEWEAIALAQAGVQLPESYRDTFYQHVESQVKDQLTNGAPKITDIERLTISAVAIGEDPRDIDGLDLIDLIYNSPMLGNSDSMTHQGNNGPIFALIALDTKDYPEPKDAKWNREKLIKELVENQNNEGSWSLSPFFESPSIDITAMAITALAPYKDQPKVEQAINKALSYMTGLQNDEGGFTESFVGGTSSEATAQAIIALTAYGMDPTDEMFTQNGNNLMDHLLTYHNTDGGFSHLPGGSNSNGMATEQAIQALVAYDYFLKGNGRFYEFGAIEEETPTVDKKALEQKIEEAEQINVKNKTEDSVKTFEKALEAAQSTLDDDEVDQAKVDEVTKNLDRAIKGLEDMPVEEVDKSKLQAEVKAAEKINVENKTKESVESFESVLQAAKSIISDDNVSQKDIDKAITDLKKAVDNLEVLVELDTETEVTAGEKITVDKTEASIKLPNNLPDNTKVIVRSVEESVETNMKPAGDIIDVDFIFEDEKDKDFKGEYVLTFSVKEGLQEDDVAIYYYNDTSNEWEFVGGDMNDDGTITTKVSHFSTYGVFVVEVNKESLQQAIENAESINTKNNTAASIQELKDAIRSGESVLNDTDATQSEIDEAVKQIEEAIKGLKDKEPEPTKPENNTSDLNEKVTTGKEIKKQNYTKESIASLEAALLHAQTVLNNDDATDADRAEALKALETALDGLVEKSEREDEDESVNFVPKNNGNGEDNTPPQNGDAEQTNKLGDMLPKTATSNYTLIAVGVLLLLVATMMIIAQRRKVRE